jgi:pyridoxine kinase
MGDMGRGIYVKPDIPGIFKNELCPLADIVTPNQFELEALTGIGCGNMDNARRAIELLHKIGPTVVLVTSYFDGKKPVETKGKISMLVSDCSGLFRLSTPELPLAANAAGCGDLTASVFLCRYLQTRDSKTALESCAGSVYGILERSFAKSAKPREPLELLLVEAQEELVNPSHSFEAEKI